MYGVFSKDLIIIAYFHTFLVEKIVEDFKSEVDLPVESDINGAAWALVRLQDVYDLDPIDMVKGTIKGRKSSEGLTGAVINNI